MAEEKPDEKPSELQLGIRELFRILVPGAYVMALLSLFAPRNEVVQLAERGTTNLLVASLFFGLIGYAARLHERCFPYFFVFERYRKPLNQAIIAATGKGGQRDNVDLYKYFLETCGSTLRDRIHYFSSFYYMLIELSFVSFVAALSVLCWRLSVAVGASCRTLAAFAYMSMLFAVLVQVALLFGLSGIRTGRLKVLSGIPLFLAVIGILILALISGWSSSIESFMENYIVPVFLLLAFAFERLGAKHWQQITSEQNILVKDRADYLAEISKKL